MAAWLSAALFVSAAIATPAQGQRKSTRPSEMESDVPGTPSRRIESPRARGFQLFALGDLGVTGMRMTGEFGFATTSYGPCDDGFTVSQCGDVFSGGRYRFSVFGIGIVAGTPPSEFAKIAAANPAAAPLVRGGGFSAIFNDPLFGAVFRFGPADGQAGRLFSGVTTTDDGSCRDFTSPLNGYVSTGFSILPVSDCPETLVGPFDGPRLLADTAFIPQFQTDRNNFKFDFFRVPRETQQASEFAGDFSTYGLISDNYAEILESYGGITKLGSGTPTIEGYPLGLDMRFDAFQFGFPAIKNVVFYQLTVVNNSARLYGTGISYDSLYMGLRTSWGRAQATTSYWEPGRNAQLTTEIGASSTGNCNGARTAPGTLPCATVGFGRGATGVIVLKSPIGDVRNKLFTIPGNAFFNPSNVNAGDTITFNHGRLCGFGLCWDQTWAVNNQRSFAIMSSTGANYLQGRDPNALTAAQFYRVFRNVDFPTRTPKFNTYVPGGFDYNKDGIQDTLFFDSCHLEGCAKTFSDTMPGTTRYTNRGTNVGGGTFVGPFKLRAGDTTSFIYAILGSPDSASFERTVNAATRAYTTFFLVPKPPPAPVVTRVTTVPALLGAPQVVINFTDPSASVNQFLRNISSGLRREATSEERILNRLNPTLADSIDARARDQLEEILVFKSCDGGSTFTGDADCDGDPLVGEAGQSVGLGFQPYAIIRRNAAGLFPTTFTDNNVIGGRTYLYSFVSRSRGFRTAIRDSVGTGTSRREVARDSVFVDSAVTNLRRSGSSVAIVYVPVSLPAGSQVALAQFTNQVGNSTIPILARFGQNVQGGTFRLEFGNLFTIREAVATSGARGRRTEVTREVVAPNARTASGEFFTNVQREPALRFVSDSIVSFVGSNRTTTTTSSGGSTLTTADDSTITTTVITGTGFVALLNNRPLFVSTQLTGDAATPTSFLNRPEFPGFLISLNQSRADSLNLERLVEPDGDTVPNGIINGQGVAVNYQETRSRRQADARGLYEFNFAGDLFGPGAPFRVNIRDANAVEATINQSLLARPVTMRADTSAAAIAAVRAISPASFATRAFLPVALPFSVMNVTFGRTARVVVPQRAAANNTIRIGSGTTDTVSITVPDSVYLPGDTIYIVEDVPRDSLIGGVLVVRDSSGTRVPVRISSPVVTLGPVVLDCNNASTPRLACNPLAIGTPGATGYFVFAPGTKLVLQFDVGFRPGDVVTANVSAQQNRPATLSSGDLRNVRVVPNPFIVQSQFNTVNNARTGDSRVLFTNVPTRGSVRIYSVSGQFLQEINYTEADLNGFSTGQTGTGDLPYDLRTREQTDLSSGLYIFVIRGAGRDGREQVARGKFVIIR